MRMIRRALLGGLLALLLGGLGLWLAGYRLYVIHTGSMNPTLVPGDLLVDGPAGGPYHPGQIITFRHAGPAGAVVTHRMAGMTGSLIETKGDANRTADPWQIRPDQVVGRVDLRIPYAGYAAVYLRQPSGVASLVIGALGLVLLWQLFFDGGPSAARPPTRSGAPDLPWAGSSG